MSALSRACAWLIVRLRWPIALAWVAAAVLVVVYLPSFQDQGRSKSLLTGLVPKDAESTKTAVRLAELFEVPVVAHSHIVQRDPGGLSDGAIERAAERAKAISDHDDPAFAAVQSLLPLVNERDVVPASREDHTTIVNYVFFDPGKTTIFDQERQTRALAEKEVSEPDDALVGITGAAPAWIEEGRVMDRGLPWVTLATVLLIALVLGIHFRSLVAPLVSLFAAGIAYVIALPVVAWVGVRFGIAIPHDAEPVLVVLLLGVVTDYAIFFLHGTKERLDAGEPRLVAAQKATAQYLPIVVTAGLIVAGGTATLMVGSLTFFRAFGPGMALTVLVSLAIAVTLVPALIAILGTKAYWPRGRAFERRQRGPSRLAYTATSRPVALVVALVSLAFLGVACYGLTETRLGITQIAGLPKDSEPRRGQDAAATGFAPGILSPTVVLLEGVSADDLPKLEKLQGALGKEPGVASALGPTSELEDSAPGLLLSEEHDAARLLLVLDREPQGGPAIEIVRRLRADLPGLLDNAGLGDAQASLAGDTAAADETVDTITDDLLRIAIAAFLVNFVLLALFLRAIVAPLYLVLTSGLALAASLGLTTLVFQGFLGYGEITYHVPIAVAVLLLSLGSDYNVFLVGRIWQYAEQRPLREAIATAAPRASRAIGVAGLALALSFASLAFIELRQFREFAFAMSVGVLLDAFVIRALLIPALVSLFGEASWWPRTRRAATVEPALGD
jgi:RND superfamily putative drug exporter